MEKSKRKEKYERHLRSKLWKEEIRPRELKRAGFKCEQCSSKLLLQVHHLIYKNLGNEQPGDLRVLCYVCHKKVHGKDVEVELLPRYCLKRKRVDRRAGWYVVWDRKTGKERTRLRSIGLARDFINGANSVTKLIEAPVRKKRKKSSPPSVASATYL